MRTSLAADVRKFPTSDAWALPASDDDEDGHDDDNDDDYDSIGSVIIYIPIWVKVYTGAPRFCAWSERWKKRRRSNQTIIEHGS